MFRNVSDIALSSRSFAAAACLDGCQRLRGQRSVAAPSVGGGALGATAEAGTCTLGARASSTRPAATITADAAATRGNVTALS